MIKYNNSDIKEWNFGDDNITKVYYGVTSGSTSRLPSGYTEVEYIENQSSAYIDTNFINTLNTEYILDFQLTDAEGDRKIIGQGFKFGFAQYDDGGYYWRIIGQIWYNTYVPTDTNRHIVYTDSGSTYIDSTLLHSDYENERTGTNNMLLFAASQSDSNLPDGNCALMKVYSCKIYDDGTLVRDFVPCMRDSDSKYGMYDLANSQFYTSANEYSFTGGSAVTPSSSSIVGNVVYQKIEGGDTPTPPTPSGHSLPNVVFSINYNAKQYDATTYTLPKTSGQLQNYDAVCEIGNYVTANTDYITVAPKTRFVFTDGTTPTPYIGRNNDASGCTITIVSKAKTTDEYSLLCNRHHPGTDTMNWMYRQYTDHLTFHGNAETGQIACSTSEPSILSVRTYYDANNGVMVKYNNWSTSASTAPQSFTYGYTTYTAGQLFSDYYQNSTTEFWGGDFYWVYMSQEVLTDEQIQQVIDYNENIT